MQRCLFDGLAGALGGFQHLPGYFDVAGQLDLLTAVLACVDDAPLYRPSMPRSGAPLSVMMTNLGPLGWVADKSGYRYQAHHPVTGAPWPDLPAALLSLWEAVADYPGPPEACLVNYYTERSKIGLHIDQDEAAIDAAVVSVSLGDDAVYQLGGLRRKDPTQSLVLRSGDVVVLGGASRRAYHGVSRIKPGTSHLLSEAGWAQGGRINLTLRRVNPWSPTAA